MARKWIVGRKFPWTDKVESKTFVAEEMIFMSDGSVMQWRSGGDVVYAVAWQYFVQASSFELEEVES